MAARRAEPLILASASTVRNRSANRRVAMPIADTGLTATRPDPSPSLTVRNAMSRA